MGPSLGEQRFAQDDSYQDDSYEVRWQAERTLSRHRPTQTLEFN
jgi:hypothetical protein